MNNESRIEYRPYGYNFSFTVKICELLPDKLSWGELGLGKQCLCIFDRKAAWFALDVQHKLISEGYKVSLVALDVGLKDLDSVVKIWNAMIETQPAFSVAVGGGTTCDLTGFASSCYRRGIPVVLLPTTLLAMADVCISGKTGVDFGNVKNSLGTIHFPRLSLCVLDALRTLEETQFRSGLAEIVKVAVTSSTSLFYHLESVALELTPHYSKLLDLVETSCQLKARIVEGTPTIRLHSMYGHLVGQAIESLDCGKYLHGDCVSIGMNIEGYIAVRLGIWDRKCWKRQLRLLVSLGLPITVPVGISTTVLLQQMHKDKLAMSKHFNMILPSSIGAIHTVEDDSQTPVPHQLAYDCLYEFAKLTRDNLIEISKVGHTDTRNGVQ